MKCPTCGFITDPSKDLCSRCFADLRDQKKVLGLIVVNPEAPYQELLARRVRIVDSPKSSSKRTSDKPFFSFLKKKHKPAEAYSSPEIEVPEPTISEADSAAENEALVTQQASTQTIVEPEAQKLRLGKRQKQQILGLLRQRKTEEEIRNQDQTLLNSPEESEKSRLTVVRRETESVENLVWNQVSDDLAAISYKISGQSAIQISSLLSQDSQSALSVYFDLAMEELSSPENKRQFIKQLGDRKVESIESEELKKAVGLYREDSARQESTRGSGSVNFINPQFGQPALCAVRLCSWCLDLVLTLSLSIFVSLMLYPYSASILSELLIGAASFHTSNLFSIAIYAMPVFLVTQLLLLPLSRIIFGYTFGEFITNLRLFSEDSKYVSLMKSISWNLLSIFALFSLGISEIRREQLLWREKTLSARLLRT